MVTEDWQRVTGPAVLVRRKKKTQQNVEKNKPVCWLSEITDFLQVVHTVEMWKHCSCMLYEVRKQVINVTLANHKQMPLQNSKTHNNSNYLLQ